MPLTNAHVIPQAIGGRLRVKFLCKPCNSTLGHTVEAGVKTDPRVRLAIEALREQVPPALARKMREGQLFVARNEGIVVRATATRDGYRILDSPQADGTRIKETAAARREIETTLRRRGGTDPEITAALAKHDNAADGEVVPVARELAVRKGYVDAFSLPFSEPFVPDVCSLAIAYLFLAVAVGGKAIYMPALVPVRATLRGASESEGWSVESLRADRPYEPWHGLAIDAIEPRVVVQIRLFGHIAFRVTFSAVSCRAGTFVRSYAVDLTTGRERWLRGGLMRHVPTASESGD
jgi:hypothetical protein